MRRLKCSWIARYCQCGSTYLHRVPWTERTALRPQTLDEFERKHNGKGHSLIAERDWQKLPDEVKAAARHQSIAG